MVGAVKSILSIENLSKTYKGGFKALDDLSLEINQGEIFALLGPNGAGKTTLINIICGIVTYDTGTISVDGYDVKKQYRQTRSQIGLVPQELLVDTFSTVWNTVNFSRGLFGKAPNPELIEKILKDLSLWDKKDNQLLTLSGGMKRRVLIAKALSHEPKVLFLDEPTAGVDVELRKSMWKNIQMLRNTGVTIILTTHYIQEAQEMADRIGFIGDGKLLLVEEKEKLMKRMGKKHIIFELEEPLADIPNRLKKYDLMTDKNQLVYQYQASKSGLNDLMNDLKIENLRWNDISTRQSSLEEIFAKVMDS